MVTKSQAMAMSKEQLADIVAGKTSRKSRASILAPISKDGVNVVTLGTEIGLIGPLFDKGGQAESPAGYIWNHKDAGTAAKAYINRMKGGTAPWGIILVGSVGVKVAADMLKKKRTGILKWR